MIIGLLIAIIVIILSICGIFFFRAKKSLEAQKKRDHDYVGPEWEACDNPKYPIIF